MDKKEYEEIEQKANELEHNASIKCSVEVQKAQDFKKKLNIFRI